jgi:RsiW-degrading membrane proteinase PrsW (M82 family)
MSRVRTVVTTDILLLLVGLALAAVAFVIERLAGLDDPVELSPALALALAAVPGAVWLAYFSAHDRADAAPRRFVLGVYLLGAVAAGPLAELAVSQVVGWQGLAPPALSPLAPVRVIETFAVVALAQQIATYAVVRYSVFATSEFATPLDGIVYTTAAALGLATYTSYRHIEVLNGAIYLSAGAGQAVLASIEGACTAGALGYAMARAKFATRAPAARSATLFSGIVAAAVMGGQFHLVRSMLETDGFVHHRWRGLAYTAGLAVVILFVVSLLVRRLVATPTPAGRGGGTSVREETP